MPNPRRSFEQNALQRAFGERVREIRKSQSLSQEQLAERSGLDRTYIVSIEQGHRNISLVAIGKVASGLRVPIALLFE